MQRERTHYEEQRNCLNATSLNNVTVACMHTLEKISHADNHTICYKHATRDKQWMLKL